MQSNFLWVQALLKKNTASSSGQKLCDKPVDEEEVELQIEESYALDFYERVDSLMRRPQKGGRSGKKRNG